MQAISRARKTPVAAVAVTAPDEVGDLLSQVSMQTPSLLGDAKQEQYVMSFSAVMDREGVVFSATSGHMEVADLACMRLAVGLLRRAAENSPTLAQPYLANAVNSVQAALALRDGAGASGHAVLH